MALGLALGIDVMGEFVGRFDGIEVLGASVGLNEGMDVLGASVGLCDGTDVVGASVGLCDGVDVVGDCVGLLDGTDVVGEDVGLCEGLCDGTDVVGEAVGLLDGTDVVGEDVGLLEGTDVVGARDGDLLGLDDVGALDGDRDGRDVVGALDGERDGRDVDGALEGERDGRDVEGALDGDLDGDVVARFPHAHSNAKVLVQSYVAPASYQLAVTDVELATRPLVVVDVHPLHVQHCCPESPIAVDAVLMPVQRSVVGDSVGKAVASETEMAVPVQIWFQMPSDVPVGPLTGVLAWIVMEGVPNAVVVGTGDVSPSKKMTIQLASHESPAVVAAVAHLALADVRVAGLNPSVPVTVGDVMLLWGVSCHLRKLGGAPRTETSDSLAEVEWGRWGGRSASSKPRARARVRFQAVRRRRQPTADNNSCAGGGELWGRKGASHSPAQRTTKSQLSSMTAPRETPTVMTVSDHRVIVAAFRSARVACATRPLHQRTWGCA